MTTDTAFPLSQQQLEQWFDAVTFHRAQAYLQAGKVVKLEYKSDLSDISAQVWGAAFTPYRHDKQLAGVSIANKSPVEPHQQNHGKNHPGAEVN